MDSAHPQTRRPPSVVASFAVAIATTRVVGFDNLSGFSDRLSDSLCRAVTGDGDVGRQLYSDDSAVVFSYPRALVVNRINLTDVRDDLAQRMLPVELHRIDEQHRAREFDLNARWATAHPRVLGALLDLGVRVLAAQPTVMLERSPRMTGFAQILVTVDRVLGTDGLAPYVAQAENLAADTASSDVVPASIVGRIQLPWQGNAAELLMKLRDQPGFAHKEMPTTGKELTPPAKVRA